MSDNAEQLDDAIEVKGLMTRLKANNGWDRLCVVLEEKIEERDRKLDHPLVGMDEVLNQEYVKGARQAYRSVLDMPDAIIESAEAVIEMVKDLEEDNGAEEEG